MEDYSLSTNSPTYLNLIDDIISSEDSDIVGDNFSKRQKVVAKTTEMESHQEELRPTRKTPGKYDVKYSWFEYVYFDNEPHGSCKIFRKKKYKRMARILLLTRTFLNTKIHKSTYCLLTQNYAKVAIVQFGM